MSEEKTQVTVTITVVGGCVRAEIVGKMEVLLLLKGLQLAGQQLINKAIISYNELKKKSEKPYIVLVSAFPFGEDDKKPDSTEMPT